MPFDFSELDNDGGQQEETPSNVERIIFQPDPQSEPQPDNFDEQMSEVEKRLEIASYYRLLLDNSLFTDSSPTAQAVDAEIRAFIKDRLAFLLNIKQAPSVTKVEATPAQFSEEEAIALRQLAAKIIASPGVLDNKKPAVKKPEEKKPPELRRVAPQVKPAEVKPQAQKPVPVAVQAPQQPAGAPVKRPRGRPRTNFSPHAAPMPTGQAFTMLAAQQAEQSSNSAISQGGEGGLQMIAGAMKMPVKVSE